MGRTGVAGFAKRQQHVNETDNMMAYMTDVPFFDEDAA